MFKCSTFKCFCDGKQGRPCFPLQKHLPSLVTQEQASPLVYCKLHRSFELSLIESRRRNHAVNESRHSTQIVLSSLVAVFDKPNKIAFSEVFVRRKLPPLPVIQRWQKLFTKSIPNETCIGLSLSEELLMIDKLFCA